MDQGPQHRFVKDDKWATELYIDYLIGIELTESNLISEYLTEKYDTKGIFSIEGEQNKLLVKQWLGFQAASQGPFFAQVNIPTLIPSFVLISRWLYPVGHDCAACVEEWRLN